MEKIVKQGLLYDFYGELLTAHQRAVYEDLVLRKKAAEAVIRAKNNKLTK